MCNTTKKPGKYERDLAQVNAIMAKDHITHEDRLQLLQIYNVSFHETGKIEDLFSLDSSCNGCTFCAKMRAAAEKDPSIICGRCYDAKQEEYRTAVKNRHMLNLRIMSTVEFTIEELETIRVFGICRINSSGDIENEVHARNMVRYAYACKGTPVALWAKNTPAVETAMDQLGKPENLVYIASSIRIDKPGQLPKYADYTFTVYSSKEKVQEALARGAGECNGKKCKACGFKCYLRKWAQGQDIAELLR